MAFSRSSNSSSSKTKAFNGSSYQSTVVTNDEDVALESLIHKKKKSSIKSVYNMKQEIGRGSWGVVRKCQHKRTKEWFACKSIQTSKVPPAVLEQEILNLERAKGHPHLIELVDFFQDKKEVHIVTELLEGGELYEQVVQLAEKRQRFPPQAAAFMIRNILDAIRHLHEDCNVVHRDLKASNFLFATAGNAKSVKIIDFGLSQHKVPPSKDEPAIFKDAVGTVYYVAPEVLTHDETGYTNKCDIWSVGVIAYLVLSASLPFQGKDERETCKLLMNDNVQAEYPESKWSDKDLVAIDFCKALLQKDPSRRPSARAAMSHPFLTKYCGKSVFADVAKVISKEKTVTTEKTLDDVDADLELMRSLSGEETWCSPTKCSESSASPRIEVVAKEDDKEVLSAVAEDAPNKKRGSFRRMFSRSSRTSSRAYCKD